MGGRRSAWLRARESTSGRTMNPLMIQSRPSSRQKPPTYCVLCDDDHGEVIGYLACRACGETYCPEGVCQECCEQAFLVYHRLTSVVPLHRLLKPLRIFQHQFKHAPSRTARRRGLRAIQQFHEDHRVELMALHYYD